MQDIKTGLKVIVDVSVLLEKQTSHLLGQHLFS